MKVYFSSFVGTYLFLLLIKVVYDDSDEQIEGEKRAKDDEKDKVEVHVDVDFTDGLLAKLKFKKNKK